MPPVLKRRIMELYVPLRYQLSASGPRKQTVYIVHSMSQNMSFANACYFILLTFLASLSIVFLGSSLDAALHAYVIMP